MSDSVTCPTCEGMKVSAALVNRGSAGCTLEELPCSTCRGTGTVDQAYIERLKSGRVLRSARLARGESLRDAAQRMGVSVVALSKMERGESTDADA